MHSNGLVIFDWDGTLVDSIGLITDCLVEAAHDCGESISKEAARHIIGLSLPVASGILLPNASVAVQGDFMEAYKKRFIALCAEPKPFDDAVGVLHACQELGLHLAVATGKSRVGLDRALGFTGWGHFFAATRCADETKSKPHPLMIEQILNAVDIQQQPVFMVGDTTFDLELGQNAGAISVGVTTGAHSHETLLSAKPKCVAASLQDAFLFIKDQLVLPSS